MHKNLKSQKKKLQLSDAVFPKEAAWSGYTQPYVQNIVKNGLKVLKLLATLTFDPGLLMWIKGLEGHLNKKMKEAEEEKKRVDKLRF